jgi:hypothetical protein
MSDILARDVMIKDVHTIAGDKKSRIRAAGTLGECK